MMEAEATSPTQRFFRDFFPPPRFLTMPAAGVDISERGIRMISLRRRKGGVVVEHFAKREVPVEGAGGAGALEKKAAVARALRELAEEFGLHFANASLPEEKAYLFKTQTPPVPPREIRGLLEFKLEENVPIPIEDAVFDYAVINAHDRERAHLDVSVTVLPEKVVREFVELFAEAGLTPLSFETESRAIARAVIPRGDLGTKIIVNIGETKTGIFIASSEVVQFAATVAVGGAHMTEAIAKQFSLSVEAARAKKESALSGVERSAALSIALANVASLLRDEVNKLSNYWQTHREGAAGAAESGTEKEEKVILCGRDAAIPGFDEYLGRSLGREVSIADVWTNVCSLESYVPPILFHESLEYAAAIGLALPSR